MSTEFTPDFGDFEREFTQDPTELRVFGLIINFRSALHTAEKLQAQRMEILAEKGLKTARRHILKDPKNDFLPVWTDRITLGADDKKSIHGVKELIVRFPSADATLPLEHPNDIFTEVVFADESREHYLLNSQGLRKYRTASEVPPNSEYDKSGDLFVVQSDEHTPVGIGYLMNRLVAVFVPQDRLASETGPE